MHRRAVLFLFAGAALLAPRLAAHEGHDHKLLGTVAEIGPARLVVKTAADGLLTPVGLTPTTRITRAKKIVVVASMAVGDRVVVNIGSGKAPLTAKAIDAAPASATR